MGVRVWVEVRLGLGVSVAVDDSVGAGVWVDGRVALGCTVLDGVGEESSVRLHPVSQRQSTATMNHKLRLFLFANRKE